MPRLAFGRAKSRTPSPAWRSIPMKAAMKARQMDERTNRILKITQAIDQVTGPLRPMMERLQPLNEWRNSNAVLVALTAERLMSPLASASVVTDQKPLRAPGFQIHERTEPVPVLQSPAATAKRSESPNERGDRILKRVEEKKAAGVKAFLREVAVEEGLSESTTKQIVGKARKRRDKQ